MKKYLIAISLTLLTLFVGFSIAPVLLWYKEYFGLKNDQDMFAAMVFIVILISLMFASAIAWYQIFKEKI